jgi:uncharacterized membrane protein YhaH (DUF805 family)
MEEYFPVPKFHGNAHRSCYWWSALYSSLVSFLHISIFILGKIIINWLLKSWTVEHAKKIMSIIIKANVQFVQ